MGKGNKEGFLVFGKKTESLITQYVREFRPTDKLFALSAQGYDAPEIEQKDRDKVQST